MYRARWGLAAFLNQFVVVTAVAITAMFVWVAPAAASSHREALPVLNEPCADNTDTFAWVSPGTHDKLYLIMRPVAKDKVISSTPTMYTGPTYGPYWGGYYGYGWGGAWGTGTDIQTDTIVTVETLVYSLKQNKLLWAGQSKTTNPSNVDAFVKELAAGAVREMKKVGLL